jgi:ADP-ribosylglycohydrolase
MGYHGLIRALPVGAFGGAPGATFELAADVAALTHGAPSGFITAADGALLVVALLAEQDVHEGIAAAIRTIEEVDPESHHLDRYAQAAADGHRHPADLDVLQRHGVDRTAIGTLCAAVYVLTSFPGPEQIAEAISFAASAAGAGVATVAGALLGACHGIDALPVEMVSRLELAWVTDTLARDVVSEVTGAPGGHETLIETGPAEYRVSWADGDDPGWSRRYPGW